MGIRVKEGGAARWVARAAVAQESYVEGAKNPRTPWSVGAKAAETNWKTAIAEASAKGSYGKGVTKAGDQTWLDGVVNKGSARFAQGVALAQDKYEKGIQPYLDTLKSITLPPRGRKGDPNNILRVSAIAKALNDKKKQLKG